MRTGLPIDEHVGKIVHTVRERRAAVVVAPPGAGKTTRVPPALVEDGPVVLLQPRRVAARALARRIAAEQDWTIGREIGWQVRFEKRFSAETRLLVATEGVLTGRLARDPLLADFRTVILDEFHERSLHADLALALAKQAWLARDDLRIVVMSATLDAGPIAEFLEDCPVIELADRAHPVEIEYDADLDPATAAIRAIDGGDGDVLCFLPGAREIRDTSTRLSGALGGRDVDVRPLHGSLGSAAQDAALAPSERRKIVVATNIAETSLTIEGVTAVVDSGMHKVMRRDVTLGIDRLESERIPLDSANQRAGRAGRTGPGRAIRLWDSRQRLEARREPEIRRVDLAGPLLEVLASGEDPRRFEWFEPPPADAMEAALELLRALEATDDGKITELGRRLRRIPLHPRLARLLIEAGGTRQAAAACVALSERWNFERPDETTASDLLTPVDRLSRAPSHVRRAVDALTGIAGATRRGESDTTAVNAEERLCRAVLAAYPDRVARRREAGSPRILLASGHGATLARDSGVREANFLVAVELLAGTRGPGSEALARTASAIEAGWLEPTNVTLEHELQDGKVRATEYRWYHEVILGQRGVAPDPEKAASILARDWLQGPRDDRSAALLRRLEFAGAEIDLEAIVQTACGGQTSRREIDLESLLPFEISRELKRLAPESIPVPSGRNVRLEYREDGSVVAAVKLQELFGLAETPTVGRNNEPVTLSLLAPNGRPVQTTRDLRSFWDSTYPEVRRELRGRYPKHPWPEDPWSAPPTRHTKRRSRRPGN
jgi:ATP-dependent helicase HrpB